MSEILEGIFNLFSENRNKTLKNYQSEFDTMEKKARIFFFIAKSMHSANQRIGPGISNVVTEVFLDLSQAIYLAAQSQYRASYQSLRSSLELTMAAIYFVDHPVEFIQWKNDTFDFRFSMSDEILSPKYCSALGTDFKLNKGDVSGLYRDLSQYVHGKFEYMTIETDTVFTFNEELTIKFINEFERTFNILLNLYSYRFNNILINVCEDYAFLQNFMDIRRGISVGYSNIFATGKD